MSGAGEPLREELITLRRALHRVPELGFEERTTRDVLREHVAGWGRARPIAGTGMVVDLGPEDAPHTLLLRADMDGLPIAEATGLAYASTHPGRMHACGHDAHMAALSVAGRLLAEALPPGVRLRVLFQPAEEGKGGARACIDEGVLEGVDAAFGIHVWNELPVGTVAATRGGIMAGVVELGFRVRGRGGHGGLPHRTRDPVVAAAHLVTTLQTVVSRGSSPFDSVVLTVGAIHAGDAFNVIPDEAELRGTVRTLSEAQQERVREEVLRIAAGVGAATGTEIDVHWKVYAIPTVNDSEVAALVAEAAEGVPGVIDVRRDYRTMAGEDFGEILANVPGCFALVGSADPARGIDEPHHSPRFAISEDVLPIACGLHRAVAERFARE
ncbi:MAG: M20 metallopeptidase family protein [Myxococcota bacterium]